jgi:hypothetical protein
MAEHGACLISLDRDASRTPTRVLATDQYTLLQSSTGSPVLFQAANQLVLGAFEGVAYESLIANPSFDLVSGSAVSMGPVFWVYYFVQPSGLPGHPQFWSRHSLKTFTLAGDTTGISSVGYWSDDGHFFVSAGDRVVLETFDDDSMLHVHQLPLHVAANVEDAQMVWQP